MSTQTVSISAPNMQKAQFVIVGETPYLQLRFTEKAKNAMREKMLEGSTAKKGKKREKRDFESEFEQAMYRADKGWRGIHAASFRNAMISACKIVGFQMTRAKLAIFVEADGYDKLDGTPLVRIYGEPEAYESMVRNATGVADIRTRALWKKWEARPIIRWDADLFNLQDITNLMMRVGTQVGLGEGRPDSKNSAGLGYGLFHLQETPK